MNDAEQLAAAVARAGLAVADETLEPLARYARVMWRWNEQLNLTRHTTWDLFAGRDLRDVIQLANLLDDQEEVLDWGSGNGVPGIPLQILRPDATVSLAESVGKRAATLGEIVHELGRPITVYGGRGEALLDDFRFSSVVARAVGSIAKFCRWVEPYWINVDRLLLVKGPKWVEERGEARHLGLMQNLELRRVATYPLEGRPSGASGDTATSPRGDESTTQSEGDAGHGVILQVRRKRPN